MCSNVGMSLINSKGHLGLGDLGGQPISVIEALSDVA